MTELVNIIEEIISLSKKVLDHIEKNKISKATNELKLIIDLDLEELRRLKSQRGDLRLLIECKNVFNISKKALMQLESGNITDDVKLLINKLIDIEQHRLLEISEHDKKLNTLYSYWYDNFVKGLFYHGTNSKIVEQIKRFGLFPGAVPWDPEEIKRLDFLIKKSGYTYGIGAFYNISTSKEKVGIFLTVSKRIAISYANRSPEMWSEFVGEPNWSSNDKRRAVKKLYGELIYRGAANRRMPISDYNEIINLYDTDIKKFSIHLRELCPLSSGEINEVIRIFNKYWNFFRGSKPILVTVSSQSPAIIKKLPVYGSFESFLDLIKHQMQENVNEIMHFASFLRDNQVDLKITERISAKYILDIEIV